MIVHVRTCLTVFFISFITMVHLSMGMHFLVDKSKALHDKALHDHAFRNITVGLFVECFIGCYKDCLCLAFQICNETECQLLSNNRYRTPISLKTLTGCSYYDMIPFHSKEPTCKWESGCQMNPDPCLNNGFYEEIFPSNSPRFKCKCSDGYAGRLCDDVVKSCRGYTNGSRVPGIYKVFDDTMNLFEVFCDFDLHSSMTWTLVQSYQLQHASQFRKSFSQDNPRNQDNPRWDSYSLSKSRMASINRDSSKWRQTCQYDTQGVVYTDYIEGSNGKINILTFQHTFTGGITCSGDKNQVDYVDVRGHNCTKCTAPIVQATNNPLHLDTYRFSCEFKPTGSLGCNGRGEDNFGFYGCANSAHRCSSSPTATTQTWLGDH